MSVVFIACAAVLACAFIIVAYFFFAGLGELKKWKREWKIMGIREGFTPQGIAYSRVYKKFFISGYMKNGEPSRIYVVDAKLKQTEKYVTLKFADGADFVGHAGGITCANSFAFISSGGKAFRFRLGDAVNAFCCEKINIDCTLSTETRADFCFVSQGLLWVGDYYKMSKFPTDITHHILHEGVANNAIVFGFRLSGEEMPCNFPEKAISIPDMVQGMEIFGEKILMSVSFGLQKSKLLEFENVLHKNAMSSIVFGDRRVPLWVIGEKFRISCTILPPMLEDFAIFGDKIYVLFESGSKKYRKFMRVRVKDVFSKRIV